MKRPIHLFHACGELLAARRYTTPTLLLMLPLFLPGILLGQDGPASRRLESGSTVVKYFRPEKWGGEPQTRGIAQDPKTGFIFVGNQRGVVFCIEGERTRTIFVPGRLTVTSIVAGPDSMLYVGYEKGYGRIRRDSAGAYHIEALSDSLDLSVRLGLGLNPVVFPTKLGVWVIGPSPDDTEPVAVLVTQDSTRVVRFKKTQKVIACINGNPIVYEAGSGLAVFENGTLHPINGSEHLPAQDSIRLFDTRDGSFLLRMPDGEMQWYEDGVFRRWRNELQASRLTEEIHFCLRRNNGNLLFVLYSNAIVEMSRDGSIVDFFPARPEYLNDQLNIPFVDREDGLWLGLDNRIARVQLNPTSTVFEYDTGIDGTLGGFARLGNTLYVGTGTGVYRLLPKAPGPGELQPRRLQRVGSVSGVTEMRALGDEVLICGAKGLVSWSPVRGEKLELDLRGCYSFIRLGTGTDSLLLGTVYGLYLATRAGGTWTAQRFKDVGQEWILSVIQLPNGELWVGTYNQGVAYRLERGDNSSSGFRAVRYDSSHGIPVGETAMLLNDRNDLILVSFSRMYRFDRSRERFVPWEKLHALFPDRNAPFSQPMATTSTGDLAVQLGDKRIGLLQHVGDSALVWKEIVSPLEEGAEFYCIYCEADGTIWFGGAGVLVRSRPYDNPLPYRDFVTMITGVIVRNQDTTFSWGAPAFIRKTSLLPREFRDDVKSIVIQFAVPSYQSAVETQYRYKLEGRDANWSEWSSIEQVEYMSLPGGDYRLLVEGKVGDMIIAEQAAFSFRIVVPWYRSWWAMLLASVLLTLGIVSTIARQRTRRLLRQKQELEQTVRERTDEIRVQAQEIQGQADELRTLDGIVQVVNRELELPNVLDTLLLHALKLFPQSRHSLYLRFAGEDKSFEVLASTGDRSESLLGLRIGYHELLRNSISGLDMMAEGIWTVRDVLPFWNKSIGLQDEGRICLMVMVVEIDGKLEGLLAIDGPAGDAFCQADVVRMQRLRGHAVSAVSKAHMLDVVRRSNEELQSKNEELDSINHNLVSMQEQLVTQEKLAALGGIVAGIAHEIQNPLNFVNNFSLVSQETLDDMVMLLRASPDGLDRKKLQEIMELLDTLHGNFQRIHEHGRRATSIVHSMLSHSRPGKGRYEAVKLNDLLDQFVMISYHGARLDCPDVHLELHKHFGQDVGEIRIMPQEMSRVVLNLCSNGWDSAIERYQKSGGDAPRLDVYSARFARHVELRVRDNGYGIPQHIRKRIFDPFFTTKPTDQGTGLGLSISHDIVTRLHRGNIHVETEVGKYAEFVVSIPI